MVRGNRTITTYGAAWLTIESFIRLLAITSQIQEVGLDVKIGFFLNLLEVRHFGIRNDPQFEGELSYAVVYCLFPKIAVPMRTRVAPSLMAVSKSPVIPMESSSIVTFGMVALLIRSRRFRSSIKNGRTRPGS